MNSLLPIGPAPANAGWAEPLARAAPKVRTATRGRRHWPSPVVLKEVRQLRDDNLLTSAKVVEKIGDHTSRVTEATRPLPSVLTVAEFAFLIRRDEEVIRRKIRARIIKAHDRPALIPCRELLKYGVDLGDAAKLLAHRAAEAMGVLRQVAG